MGIYTVVNLTLICDSCQKEIGKINTAKDDVPLYATATITCQSCLEKGVEHPGGTTTTEMNDYVDSVIASTNNAAEIGRKD